VRSDLAPLLIVALRASAGTGAHAAAAREVVLTILFAELLAGAGHALLVFGHTHLAFVRRAESGTELLNPGSVGMPFDGDHRAAWAVLGDDGTIRHRRVSYDHAASAAAVRGRLGEAGEVPARRIERASFDAD
jgi:diadenosine tetraphosphatase ApaH/serine/threonine PP2A family protein phosphatase